MFEKFTLFMLIGRDEEKGATAVEYALMVALIAVFIIAAVQFLGGALDGLFRRIGGAL